MEQKYENKTINARGLALRWLAIITGVLTYLPVHLYLSEDYLVRGSSYYLKDLTIFIVSIIAVLVCLFVWRAIYKQFKKDKTALGFSPDKSGVALMVEIIIEAVVSFLAIYLTSSNF